MNTYKWIYYNNITDDEWNSILKFIKEHRTVYNDVMEAIDETVDYFIQDTIEPDTHFRWNTVEQFKGKLVDITDIYYVPGIDNGVCATVNPIKDIYVTISDIETIESMQDGDIGCCSLIPLCSFNQNLTRFLFHLLVFNKTRD